MIHFVISTEPKFYHEWQSEFLWRTYTGYGLNKWSKMTRLISTKRPELIYPTSMPHVVTPSYVNYRGCNYAALNKPCSIFYWLENYHIEEEYICVLDPDMIFIREIGEKEFIYPKKGEMIGTASWYLSTKYRKNSVIADLYNIPHDKYIPNGVPYIFHKNDLKNFIKHWLINTVELHKAFPNEWLVEMHAVSVAIHQTGIKYKEWENWVFESNQFILPKQHSILHYCSTFSDEERKWTWKKHLWTEEKFPLDLNQIPELASLPAKVFFEHIKKCRIDKFTFNKKNLMDIYVRSKNLKKVEEKPSPPPKTIIKLKKPQN